MLSKLALKNIKSDFKNYKMYFFSVAFNAIIVYLFLSLRYNAPLNRMLGADAKIEALFRVASIAILLFAIIFIWYATSFFLKRRKKEIGLYALLGVKKSQIGWMMFIETLIAGLASIIVGLGIGVLFSRLLFQILSIILGLTDSLYQGIELKALGLTFAAFLLIFVIAAIGAQRIIYRFQLTELFGAEIKEEKPLTVKPGLAALGAIFMLAAYSLVLFIKSGSSFIIGIPTAFLLAVVGTFLIYRHVVPYLFGKIRQGDGFFKNIQTVMNTSNTIFRIRKNYRLWALLSLLTAGALAFILGGSSLYYTMKEATDHTAPFTFSYIYPGEEVQNKVDELMDSQTKNKVVNKQRSAELIVSGNLPAAHENPDWSALSKDHFYVVSETIIKDLEKASHIESGIPKELADDEVAVLEFTSSTQAAPFKGKTMTLDNREFKIAAHTPANLLITDESAGVIVVSNKVYDDWKHHNYPTREIISYTNENVADTKGLTLKLQNILPKEAELQYAYEMVPVVMYSKILMTVLSFVDLVFLFATGSIFCFKSLIEGEEDLEKYRILHNLGAKKSEIKKVINAQVRTMFAMPLILVLFNGLAICAALNNWNLFRYATPAIVSFVLLLVIFFIYYLIASRSLYQRILKQD